jgi:L-rhamnose-H+ transport protein
MTSTILPMLILVIAGEMNASFPLPMKYTHRWAWENTWLAWTFFALVLLPPVLTFSTVPQLGQVYHAAPAGILLEVIFFGAGWGWRRSSSGLP